MRHTKRCRNVLGQMTTKNSNTAISVNKQWPDHRYIIQVDILQTRKCTAAYLSLSYSHTPARTPTHMHTHTHAHPHTCTPTHMCTSTHNWERWLFNYMQSWRDVLRRLAWKKNVDAEWQTSYGNEFYCVSPVKENDLTLFLKMEARVLLESTY